MRQILPISFLFFTLSFFAQTQLPAEMINPKQKQLYRYHSHGGKVGEKYQSYKIYTKFSSDSSIVSFVKKDRRPLQNIVDSLKGIGFTSKFKYEVIKDAILNINIINHSYFLLDTTWQLGKIKSIDSTYEVSITLGLTSASKGINKSYIQTEYTHLKRNDLQKVLKEYKHYKLYEYVKTDIYYLECWYDSFFVYKPDNEPRLEVFQRGFWHYF